MGADVQCASRASQALVPRRTDAALKEFLVEMTSAGLVARSTQKGAYSAFDAYKLTPAGTRTLTAVQASILHPTTRPLAPHPPPLHAPRPGLPSAGVLGCTVTPSWRRRARRACCACRWACARSRRRTTPSARRAA